MKNSSIERMYSIFEETFPLYFFKIFNSSEEIQFVEDLKKHTEVFVFSGILRDFLLRYNGGSFRDVDLVISETNVNVEKVISKYLVRKNQFGGYKCLINDIKIDIWSIDDTWAIKKYKPFNLYNYLPLTSFFNITAAVYSLNNKKLNIHDSFKEFLENKKHRKLDYVLKDNPYPALCVIKTLELSEKFHLRLTDRLKDYIIHYLKVLPEYELYEIQMKHYGLIKFNYKTINEKVSCFYTSTRTIEKKKKRDKQLSLFY